MKHSSHGPRGSSKAAATQGREVEAGPRKGGSDQRTDKSKGASSPATVPGKRANSRGEGAMQPEKIASGLHGNVPTPPQGSHNGEEAVRVAIPGDSANANAAVTEIASRQTKVANEISPRISTPPLSTSADAFVRRPTHSPKRSGRDGKPLVHLPGASGNEIVVVSLPTPTTLGSGSAGSPLVRSLRSAGQVPASWLQVVSSLLQL